ncbi:hypothetical protein ACQPZF_38845 [Actinosynnema sp. CS-041913]|uniref:hypothetical protein n=1 Tax=Actinosynnema sp. CS-041913 TaxID=3239917 RepID=UPI003D919014
MTTDPALPGLHSLTGEHARRYAAGWTRALRGIASVRGLRGIASVRGLRGIASAGAARARQPGGDVPPPGWRGQRSAIA